MSQITFAIRQATQSEMLFRWQATVIAAFAGGSLTAALLNLAAAVGFAVTKSALVHATPALKRVSHRA